MLVFSDDTNVYSDTSSSRLSIITRGMAHFTAHPKASNVDRTQLNWFYNSNNKNPTSQQTKNLPGHPLECGIKSKLCRVGIRDKKEVQEEVGEGNSLGSVSLFRHHMTCLGTRVAGGRGHVQAHVTLLVENQLFLPMDLD